MPESIISFFGQYAKVNCDGNCEKAWGINNRPQIQLSDNEDDTCYLADDELGIAPIDPGTYEGGHAKPESADMFPNKWCVRECERSNISKLGEYNLPLSVIDFSKRVFNLPQKDGDKNDK